MCVASYILITFMFVFYFLSAKKESSKEIRLAGAFTGKETSMFLLPAAHVLVRRVLA